MIYRLRASPDPFCGPEQTASARAPPSAGSQFDLTRGSADRESCRSPPRLWVLAQSLIASPRHPRHPRSTVCGYRPSRIRPGKRAAQALRDPGRREQDRARLRLPDRRRRRHRPRRRRARGLLRRNQLVEHGPQPDPSAHHRRAYHLGTDCHHTARRTGTDDVRRPVVLHVPDARPDAGTGDDRVGCTLRNRGRCDARRHAPSRGIRTSLPYEVPAGPASGPGVTVVFACSPAPHTISLRWEMRKAPATIRVVSVLEAAAP